MPGGFGTPRRYSPDAGPWHFDIDANASSGNLYWTDPPWGPGALFGKQSQSAIVHGDSTSPQYAARWWWLDFGPTGGLWDCTLLHTPAFDGGNYSIRVDDVEVGVVDGYNAGIVADTYNTVTGIRIPGGWHKVSLVMATKDAPSSSYFSSLERVWLLRTASLPQLGREAVRGLPKGRVVANRVIQLLSWFASGNTSWDTVVANSNVPGGIASDTGLSGTARWWRVYLSPGAWAVEFSYRGDSTTGIITVSVDDVDCGTVDTYNPSGVNLVGSVTVPIGQTGFHKIGMSIKSKSGSSSGYNATVWSLRLRQVSARRDGDRSLWPWSPVSLNVFKNAGNTNWSTVFSDGTTVFWGDVYTTSAVNAAMWWYVGMDVGTWAIDLLYRRGTNMGIYSVRIDDVEVGTVDGYGSAATNQRATISGIPITSTGKHKVSLVMATKNGSSSNYYGECDSLQVRKVA